MKPTYLFIGAIAFAALAYAGVRHQGDASSNDGDQPALTEANAASSSTEPSVKADASAKADATDKAVASTKDAADVESPTSADAALHFAMPTTPKGVPEQLLFNDAYVSSFNNQTLMPNWVAWRLIADHAEGSVQRKGVEFTPDDRVDERCRVTTYDYMRSGYDRGHMCPAADNKWSQRAMVQCFLLTNICPQDHGLNVGDWNEMENQCRRWAKQYGEIYIVSGPILYRSKHKRIGSQHKVTVPEAFFKVVLCLKGTPKGIGFIYRNTGGNRPKGDYVNSIDQVERITGLDFFPSLPDKTEKVVEAEANLNDWY